MMGRAAPVVLVTGIAEEAMACATMALQWDLPRAVVVDHTIDVGNSLLHRTVSDVSGVIDRTVIDLEHACVSCAIREDVMPTLRRLASDGRWDAVISHLPIGAEATQVCRVAANEGARSGVMVAGVIAAIDGETVVDDLLGDDLLHERELHSSMEDGRGVGETASVLIEYADQVAFHGDPGSAGRALVAALARPSAELVPSCSELNGWSLLTATRAHEAAESWVAEVRRGKVPALMDSQVWTLDLYSDRPLHPQRLLSAIEDIGGGPRRSRGCFWLPGRPGDICGWQGAGGQLSIGVVGSWGLARPVTRITVTGMDDGADDIRRAFESSLLSTAEADHSGFIWEMASDGFEPWLGPINRAA